jgi:putative ABC transport system permease protein
VLLSLLYLAANTSMTFSDITALSFKSIRSSKLRTRITIAIIALGITALVGIITAVDSIKNSISSNFNKMGANTFTLDASIAGAKKRRGDGLRARVSYEKIDLNQALEFTERYPYKGLKSISTEVTQQATLTRNNKKGDPNTYLKAIDGNYITLTGATMQYGRNFNQLDLQNGRDVCVLGSSLAKTYFKNKINQAVNNTISINGRKYLIIGVLASKGSSFTDRTDNMALITINNARRAFNIADKSYSISVQVADLKQINYLIGEAEGVFRNIRKLQLSEQSNFSINSSSSTSDMVLENIKYVTGAAIFIGIITLFGAAIGLMNTMLVAVAERTKEVGLSKALGATSSIIRRQFLTESVIISLVGGIWGICIGIGIGNLVSLLLHSAFIIPWAWIFMAIVVCALVGIGSGLYPAIKASKLNPIDALRYE